MPIIIGAVAGGMAVLLAMGACFVIKSKLAKGKTPTMTASASV